MKVTIAVATHTLYRFPQDKLYLPVQAGAAINPKLPYTGDNTGENISHRNKNYCELTVLYWAWKNLDADYIGMCHYRRYFTAKKYGEKWGRILTGAEIEEILKTSKVILPTKRNYFIETNYTQYIHAHHEQDLVVTRAIIEEKYPEYLLAYDRCMAQTYGHHFNLFVMEKHLLDHYCEWLFDILFELERRLDISGYDEYNRRVFGFVSERLMDCWLETNHIRYTELPIVHLEGQHWIKKGANFLIRKFTNKKANPL